MSTPDNNLSDTVSVTGIPAAQAALEAQMTQNAAGGADFHAMPEPSPLLPPSALGSAGTAFTPANAPVEFQYAVVPASSLITSHGLDASVNPLYDQSLQGRDRGRAASAGQIADIAANLNPERLGANASAGEGAPIVGPDFMVESGNGRSLGILSAYAQGLPSAAGYQDYLTQNAGQFGLDPALVAGVENPVLVRMRQTQMDAGQRAAFASAANAPTIGVLSDVERAQRDAYTLTNSDLLSLYQPSESGGINPATNRDFLSAFATLLPVSERGSFVQADGSISAAGLRQTQNALLAAAYPDAPALSRMLESTDDNTRNIGAGMLSAAGDIAGLRQGVASGNLHPVDISGNISDAANLLSRLRDEGVSLERHLATGSLFGEAMPQVTEDIARFMDQNKRSGKRIGQVLSAYAGAAESLGSPQQEALFEMATPAPEEIFAGARASVENQYGVLASAGGVVAPEEIAQARAEEARQKAERARVMTEAARARADRPIASGNSPRASGWDAEAADLRAQKRAEFLAELRAEGIDESQSAEGTDYKGTDYNRGEITAPANANNTFSEANYDAGSARDTGYYVNESPRRQSVPSAVSPDDLRPQSNAKGDPFRDVGYGNARGDVFDRTADVRARRAAASEASPVESPSARRYGSYADARQAESDLVEDARNVYTARGDFAKIGNSPEWHSDIQEGRIALGLAETEQAEGRRSIFGNIREDLKEPYGALNYAYAGMTLAQGGAQYYAKTSAGQYVTPEQQETAAAGFLPGVMGVLGTVAGAMTGTPMGSWAGGMVGASVGGVMQSVIGANETRAEETRTAAESLVNSLGLASDKVKEFSAQIEASGVSTQQFGAALAAVGSVGTFGAGTGAGVAALTNSFGQYAGQDWQTIAKYTSDPLLHGMGNRFSSGEGGSGDITSLAFEAAENGDFSGLKTFQQAARAAATKNDPQFQAQAKELQAEQGSWWGETLHVAASAGRALTDHLGVLGVLANPLVAVLGNSGVDPIQNTQDAANARKAQIANGPDTAAIAENDLINQFADLKSQQIVADSGVRVAGAGISLAEARGGGSVAVGAASASLYAANAAGRTATASEISQLQADLADPVRSAGRADELKARIADAEARAAGYDVSDAEQQRSVFTMGLQEDESAFGLDIAGRQGGLTRALLSGRSYDALAGDEFGIISEEAARANQIRRSAENPLVTPADRSKMLSQATEIETGAATQQYEYRRNVFEEQQRGANIISSGAADLTRGASVLGSPQDVYNARMGQVAADQNQLSVIDNRLSQNIPFAERQQLTQQKLDITTDIATGPEQARAGFYNAESSLLSGEQGGNRAGLSRDIGIYGNAAFGTHNVFQDDRARIENAQKDYDTSPAGSVQRAQAFGRLKSAQTDQAEDQDAAHEYHPLQSTRVRDLQDEGAFRRAMEAPYMDGPDSSPLTRGNALLRDYQGDLRQAQADLKNTPATSPAYEANARAVEELKDKIAQFEHERLYQGLIPQEIEKRIGAPGGGIGVAITPLAAATAAGSGPYNPLFGGFGHHANPFATTVGGVDHEGGAFGGWFASKGGTVVPGQPSPAPMSPQLATPGHPLAGGDSPEMVRMTAQMVSLMQEFVRLARSGAGQHPPVPQAGVHDYIQNLAR